MADFSGAGKIVGLDEDTSHFVLLFSVALARERDPCR
jgi:hypothetical protein